MNPETVRNLRGLVEVGLDTRQAPPEVREAGLACFDRLAKLAGFPRIEAARGA